MTLPRHLVIFAKLPRLATHKRIALLETQPDINDGTTIERHLKRTHRK